jgi:thiosulfate/3-mercaptopyruvate sulfurtransferase
VSVFELSDPAKPGRTLTMPSAQWFSERIGALGVSNSSRVVVYDRRENMWAARLWWMLRVFGFDDAAILDGGWSAWKQAGYPVCSAPCRYPPTTFQATMRPELIVDKQQDRSLTRRPQRIFAGVRGCPLQ